MKKRYYILLAVSIAAKLAMIGLFFFIMWLACLVVDGNIHTLAAVAAVGGALAAGKRIFVFLPGVDALVSKMERAMKRAAKPQA